MLRWLDMQPLPDDPQGQRRARRRGVRAPTDRTGLGPRIVSPIGEGLFLRQESNVELTSALVEHHNVFSIEPLNGLHDEQAASKSVRRQCSTVLALCDLVPDAPAVAFEAIALAVARLAVPADARRQS